MQERNSLTFSYYRIGKEDKRRNWKKFNINLILRWVKESVQLHHSQKTFTLVCVVFKSQQSPKIISKTYKCTHIGSLYQTVRELNNLQMAKNHESVLIYLRPWTDHFSLQKIHFRPQGHQYTHFNLGNLTCKWLWTYLASLGI